MSFLVSLAIKFGLPILIKSALTRFGLPLALEDDVLVILARAKRIFDAVKARGGSDKEAVAAVRAELSNLSSYREQPDDKKTADAIKAGEPFNV